MWPKMRSSIHPKWNRLDLELFELFSLEHLPQSSFYKKGIVSQIVRTKGPIMSLNISVSKEKNGSIENCRNQIVSKWICVLLFWLPKSNIFFKILKFLPGRNKGIVIEEGLGFKTLLHKFLPARWKTIVLEEIGDCLFKVCRKSMWRRRVRCKMCISPHTSEGILRKFPPRLP